MTSGSIDSPPIVNGRPVDLAAELERTRAERDAALARLDNRTRRVARGARFRRWFVGLLALLTAILIPLTATVTWAHRTVLNTSAYVDTVAPLAKDPAVTAALARIATDQAFAALDPQPTIAAALPPKAAFLAGPIANGVKGFVQDQATNALNTQQFANLWTTANRIAHEELMKVLDGKSQAVVTTNGQVVLSVVPLLNQVLKSVQQQASELLGRNITLPQLSGTELPSQACAKISQALNRPVPSTCGQIPLFPANKLDQAQWAVRAFNRLTVLLLVLTPLLLIGTLWLSHTRRRTLLQVSIGALLVMVVLRRSMMWLQKTLIDTGKPENKDARNAIVHQLLHGFFTVSVWVLGIGLAVVALALVTGPYRWAVASRRWVRDSAVSVWRLTRGVAGRARDESTASWLREHLDLMRIAGGVLAVLLLLVLSVSWIGLLVIVVLLAAYEYWLYRLGRAAPNEPVGTGAGPPAHAG
ncbi:MAG TPA: hypothetical protein VMB79_14210 [Jatrophihabitans sp.]|nr:hypothetical protein [Jatrophihabitans sp.]